MIPKKELERELDLLNYGQVKTEKMNLRINEIKSLLEDLK